MGLLPFSAGDDDAPLSLSAAEMEMKPPNEDEYDYDEIAARLKHRAATTRRSKSEQKIIRKEVELCVKKIEKQSSVA